jgi:lipopolysaccharide export system permease protein
LRRLDRYIFRQIAGPFLFFVLVLTGTIWLGQSLKLIETIVNNSQSAGVFFELTMLVLPEALSIVLPVACFAATLYAVNRLFSDSEIVVMFATGFSWTALIRPVCIFAALVTLATYVLTLVVIPGAERELKTRLAEIRGDIVSAFLREGAFESPADDVTVYLREMGRPGEMLGVFVHDGRDPDETATYTAERAVIVSDEAGTRIVMFDGVLQLARARETEALSILRFEQFAYDLSRFAGTAEDRRRKPSEYFLPELLAFTEEEAAAQRRPLGAYRSEAHETLSAPLYALTFALIAAAFVVGPGFRRRGFLGRILAATGVALALRLAGLGLKGVVTGQAALWPAVYLPPLAGLALALWLVSGRRLTRRRVGNGARVPA